MPAPVVGCACRYDFPLTGDAFSMSEYNYLEIVLFADLIIAR
jgi:hypothetical protein